MFVVCAALILRVHNLYDEYARSAESDILKVLHSTGVICMVCSIGNMRYWYGLCYQFALMWV